MQSWLGGRGGRHLGRGEGVGESSSGAKPSRARPEQRHCGGEDALGRLGASRGR